jgi:DNA-binding response OmpR family regulator
MNQAKRILVIEDDDETRELMRLALVRRGFTVHTA